MFVELKFEIKHLLIMLISAWCIVYDMFLSGDLFAHTEKKNTIILFPKCAEENISR